MRVEVEEINTIADEEFSPEDCLVINRHGISLLSHIALIDNLGLPEILKGIILIVHDVKL
jgi:hypothetical protein